MATNCVNVGGRSWCSGMQPNTNSALSTAMLESNQRPATARRNRKLMFDVLDAYRVLDKGSGVRMEEVRKYLIDKRLISSDPREYQLIITKSTQHGVEEGLLKQVECNSSSNNKNCDSESSWWYRLLFWTSPDTAESRKKKRIKSGTRWIKNAGRHNNRKPSRSKTNKIRSRSFRGRRASSTRYVYVSRSTKRKTRKRNASKSAKKRARSGGRSRNRRRVRRSIKVGSRTARRGLSHARRASASRQRRRARSMHMTEKRRITDPRRRRKVKNTSSSANHGK